MSQDDIRVVLLEYRRVNPIGVIALAEKIGVSLPMLAGFLAGGRAKIPTWGRMDKFVADLPKEYFRVLE